MKTMYHKRIELPDGTSTTHCVVKPGLTLYHVGIDERGYFSIEKLYVHSTFAVGNTHYAELLFQPKLKMATHTWQKGKPWYVSRPNWLRDKDKFDPKTTINCRAIREAWGVGWVFVNRSVALAKLTNIIEELETKVLEQVSHLAGCKAHLERITDDKH